MGGSDVVCGVLYWYFGPITALWPHDVQTTQCDTGPTVSDRPHLRVSKADRTHTDKLGRGEEGPQRRLRPGWRGLLVDHMVVNRSSLSTWQGTMRLGSCPAPRFTAPRKTDSCLRKRRRTPAQRLKLAHWAHHSGPDPRHWVNHGTERRSRRPVRAERRLQHRIDLRRQRF